MFARYSIRDTFSKFLFPSRNYSNMDKLVNTIQFNDLKEKVLNRGLTLIDVREPSELKEDGKIPNSINIPLAQITEVFKLNNEAFKAKYGISKPDFTSDFVLSCRSGKRATTAFENLKPLGYKNISVYSGSFLDWIKNGGPVEK